MGYYLIIGDQDRYFLALPFVVLVAEPPVAEPVVVVAVYSPMLRREMMRN